MARPNNLADEFQGLVEAVESCDDTPGKRVLTEMLASIGQMVQHERRLFDDEYPDAHQLNIKNIPHPHDGLRIADELIRALVSKAKEEDLHPQKSRAPKKIFWNNVLDEGDGVLKGAITLFPQYIPKFRQDANEAFYRETKGSDAGIAEQSARNNDNLMTRRTLIGIAGLAALAAAITSPNPFTVGAEMSGKDKLRLSIKTGGTAIAGSSGVYLYLTHYQQLVSRAIAYLDQKIEQAKSPKIERS